MSADQGCSPSAALDPISVAETLREVARERVNQHRKWGQQDHPHGTGGPFAAVAQEARQNCALAFSQGEGSWRDILAKEVYEAFAEEDPVTLRCELIQVAAVAAAWVEAIDRASDATSEPTP